MDNAKARAKKLANRILQENQNGRSYRAIACEDYPGVKHGTLNRIANTQGEWLPKNEKILIALGLKKIRKLGTQLPKWFQQTDEAREWFNAKRQIIKQKAKETRDSIRNAKRR